VADEGGEVLAEGQLLAAGQPVGKKVSISASSAASPASRVI